MLDHIGVKGDQTFRLIPSNDSVKLPFPQEHQQFTVFEAVKKFVDLRGTIAKKTLKSFAPFCENKDQADKMLALAASKDKLQSEITSKWYGLLDIFLNSDLGLTTCKPSLDALL